MIIQTFDAGWGQQWPVRHLEHAVLKNTMEQLHASEYRVVVINSTWYTDQYHQTVLEYLRNTPVDYIVLIAMIDCAIPQAHWFAEIDAKVIGIGYYPGAGQLAFCLRTQLSCVVWI